jgi:hypothetical protein
LADSREFCYKKITNAGIFLSGEEVPELQQLSHSLLLA